MGPADHRPVRSHWWLWPASVALAVVLLLPWWRNHTLLRDFYDYGLIMAAAGRIEAGEHPYVDFTTPIQTLQPMLAVAAERVAGPRYLSLTYANAVFIVLGFGVLAVTLARRLWAPAAVLVAAAVVTASSGQHTIVWHNALGVFWLALVVWLTATLPGSAASRARTWAVVLLVLWLGGTTKLTYQIASLCFALLFAVRGAAQRRWSWREALGWAGASLVFGVGVPVGTEMAITGASLRTWWMNVVVVPAQSRSGLLGDLLSPGFYLRTTHDYYGAHHFGFVGAWGLLLVLAVGGLRWWTLSAGDRPERRDRRFLLLATAGAAACGAVLLATNFEISYLSAAAWLVLATGIFVGFAPREGRSDAASQLVLMLGAVSLAIPAWIDGWSGARALWGHGPLVRSDLVDASSLPPRFAYIRGLRINDQLYNSLRGLVETEPNLLAKGIPPQTWFFANSAEWLVRAYPEATHRGLPLWLHVGTTYSEADAWRIRERLATGPEIKAVFSMQAWNFWHFGIADVLEQRFDDHWIGPVLHGYTIRKGGERWRDDPAAAYRRLSSNFDFRDLQLDPDLRLRPHEGGEYLGRDGSHRITINLPIRELAGEFVADRKPASAGKSFVVTARVRAADAGPAEPALWEQTFSIAGTDSMIGKSFRVRLPRDGRCVLEVVLPDGGLADAGWRRLRIKTDPTLDAPPPVNPANVKPAAPDWNRGLFDPSLAISGPLIAQSIDVHTEYRGGAAELFVHVPAEVWFRVPPGTSHLTGDFGVREGAWTHPGSIEGVQTTVLYRKAGRISVLDERDLRIHTQPADRQPQHLDVWLPEAGGWVGIAATPIGMNNAWGHTWWRNFAVRPWR